MKQLNYLVLLAGLTLCSGCTTTKRARLAAHNALDVVTDYRLLEEKHLQEVNNQYDRDFSEIMAEITRAIQTEVQQEMDLGALHLSDRVLIKWEEETLPGAIHDSFVGMVRADYERLRKAEEALVQIRKQYTENYKEASLKLNLLKDVESNLRSLAEKPGKTKEVTALMRTLYAAYRKTMEEQKKEGGKKL